MSIAQIMTIPMTIERAGQTADRYGNAGIDWAHATSTDVLGWYDANVKRFMHEDLKNRDSVDSDGIVYLPAGTDILGTDRLVINGQRYEVFGIPAIITTPNAGVHHVECRVKVFHG